MISVNQLLSIRRRALTKRVWFRVLGREERAMVNLVIRCVKKIRSTFLARIVKGILNKLENALKSEVTKFVEAVGWSLARKVADIAFSWGNLLARKWASDANFAKYLAIIRLNTPNIFKV